MSDIDAADATDALWNSPQGPLWERIAAILQKPLATVEKAQTKGDAKLSGMDDAAKVRLLPEAIESLQKLIADREYVPVGGSVHQDLLMHLKNIDPGWPLTRPAKWWIERVGEYVHRWSISALANFKLRECGEAAIRLAGKLQPPLDPTPFTTFLHGGTVGSVRPAVVFAMTLCLRVETQGVALSVPMPKKEIAKRLDITPATLDNDIAKGVIEVRPVTRQRWQVVLTAGNRGFFEGPQK
jgi:hypothetical protein